MLTLDEQRQLVRQVREGDLPDRRRALEALLADFRGPALAAIHKTLAAGAVGREHAEEVLQAAILKLLAGGLDHFRGEAAPRTYFVRIAIHAAIDLTRQLHRELEVDEQQLLTPGATDWPERRLQLAQLREALAGCLEELPPLLRESVVLYYLGRGDDCARCAHELGVNRNTFEQRLCRGRLALADCLRRKQVL